MVARRLASRERAELGIAANQERFGTAYRRDGSRTIQETEINREFEHVGPGREPSRPPRKNHALRPTLATRHGGLWRLVVKKLGFESPVTARVTHELRNDRRHTTTYSAVCISCKSVVAFGGIYSSG
jgi:hypothetical protein